MYEDDEVYILIPRSALITSATTSESKLKLCGLGIFNRGNSKPRAIFNYTSKLLADYGHSVMRGDVANLKVKTSDLKSKGNTIKK